MSYLRMLLVLAALFASFAGSAASSPCSAGESTPPQPASPAAKPRTEAAPDDANSWRRMAEELESALLRLRKERDDWEMKAVACEARLKRAEEKLDKKAADSLADDLAIGPPLIRVDGKDVVVTAGMWYLGDRQTQSKVSIDLLLGDKVVATAKEPFSISPGGDAEVSHTFPGLAGKGTYSAKVRLDP